MRTNNLLTAIVAGVVGVLLIVFEGRGDLLTWIVIIIGLMFVIPGAYVLLSQLLGNRQRRSSMAIVSAVGCVCLGLCLCLIPSAFVSILIYVFAFTLIVCGIAQIVNLSDFKMPAGFYIVPALVTLTGIVMVFLGAEKDASVIVLISGIALVVYAVNALVEYFSSPRQKQIQQ